MKNAILIFSAFLFLGCSPDTDRADVKSVVQEFLVSLDTGNRHEAVRLAPALASLSDEQWTRLINVRSASGAEKERIKIKTLDKGESYQVQIEELKVVVNRTDDESWIIEPVLTRTEVIDYIPAKK